MEKMKKYISEINNFPKEGIVFRDINPIYTKPNIWKGFKVPDILFSGDHQAIKSWRFDQSKIITKERRSDLWKKFLNSDIRAPKGDK